MSPPIGLVEKARLQALYDLQVLDTAADEHIDIITNWLAKEIGVPIALVSLVDDSRQWFKSKVGLSVAQTPKEVAFCADTILSDAPFIVRDASHDPRFFDNPLVMDDPNIRFYGGAPLILSGGERIGTVLCH